MEYEAESAMSGKRQTSPGAASLRACVGLMLASQQRAARGMSRQIVRQAFSGNRERAVVITRMRAI